MNTEYLLMQAELIFRMILAALCGALIGFERKNRGKGAGIRTHLVVATASALMMIISKYGFSDVSQIVMGSVSDYRIDPSRLASQIVSGVGFLGAGMIYINRKTPQGLTTAAGIWAIAGIGMAIGSGMYIIGIAATILIFFAQILLHRNYKILRMPTDEHITIVIDDSEGAITYIKHILSEYDIHIEDLSLRRLENSQIELTMEITAPQSFNPVVLMTLAASNSFIKSVKTDSDHSACDLPSAM